MIFQVHHDISLNFNSDATIKRLNSHIFNMDEQIARALIVHQLLGTRISDTLTLRMDCLREKEGRYFVRIDQVKPLLMKRQLVMRWGA